MGTALQSGNVLDVGARAVDLIVVLKVGRRRAFLRSSHLARLSLVQHLVLPFVWVLDGYVRKARPLGLLFRGGGNLLDLGRASDVVRAVFFVDSNHVLQVRVRVGHAMLEEGLILRVASS